MIAAILRIWGIAVVTIKRVFAQRGLALAASLGIISAVALTMSIPIYSDSVYQNIYQKEVTRKEQEVSSMTGVRPPYAFMFRYVGAWSDPVPVEQLKPVDEYLSSRVQAEIGLPTTLFVRYIKTDTFQLFPSDAENYDDPKSTLEYMYFGNVSDLEAHMDLLEGSMPAVASTEPDSPVEVLITRKLADKLGIQVGDIYTAYTIYRSDDAKIKIQMPVKIAGVWSAKDPTEDYWFYDPSEFDTVFVVPEETIVNRVIPYMKNEVDLALWYWVLDGSRVHSAEVPALMARIAEVERKMGQLLPKTRLDISPKEMLIRFQSSSGSLTMFLYIFSIPIMVMVLTFILLIVDMMVSNRRNEIAVLRSRGATALQVIGMAVLESILLGLVGIAVGAPSSIAVAQFFGKTRSFLDFSATTSLQPDINLAALQLGAIAAIVTLFAQIIPTFTASRHSIVSYKQERARQLRAPFWQRAMLDLMLFIPAAYGAYILRKQGSLVVPKLNALVATGDPFQNPLLVLVPSLAIFSITLFILRILPFAMRLVAWIASKTKSVGILLAARYLSRTSSGYSAPLILLILTLSLSTFTATLAQTLDRHLHDQTYYKVGSDINVVEMGEYTGQTTSAFAPAGVTTTTTTAEEEEPPKWVFLPVYDHLKVPGVQAAARVYRNDLRIVAGTGGGGTATYIGIDRIDFPKAGFWRRDFASESLGALMNKLALAPEAVLVSEQLVSDYNINMGDLIEVATYSLEATTHMTFKVIGTFRYFPSWYPSQGELIVGNLDNYFEQAGGELPYDVWLKVDQNTDSAKIIEGISDLYNNVLYSEVSTNIIIKEQERPERQGFFGLLSVGFTALSFLTVLGFLLYALFSFRRRFIELGMLRAIGLSAWQMFVLLASELAFLFMVGLGAGTGLGVVVSNFFIPYLQIGNTPAARIPPYVVHIDWGSVFQIYILFGLLFVVALSVLTFLLMRMKIFQAVKMGEAV